MELRRDVVVGIGVVVVFAAACSFAATALQERVVRSIVQIEAAHMQSVEISLEISRSDLTEFSPLLRDSLRAEASALVPLALSKAEEEDIRNLIKRIDEWSNESGSESIVSAARQVARRNLEDLQNQGSAMSRHAQGGVWILLLLATVGAMSVTLAWRWAKRRIFEPVERIASVLEVAAESRTSLRASLSESPRELREIQWEVEELLDQRERVATSLNRGGRIPLGKVAAAMLQQLDGEAILGRSGQVVAANSDGMNALQGARGRQLRGLIADLALRTPGNDPLSTGEWEVRSLNGGFSLWRPPRVEDKKPSELG